ncbi:MAG: multidrug ABC transporter ATP-binding protein, partial [Clostridiales bacterium]
MSEQKRPPRMRGPMGHGPGAAAIPGEKAHDFKGTIKKLLIYLGKYKLAIALVLFFAVLSAAFNIIGPKILGQATTEVFNGILAQIRGTGGINFGYIGMIVLIMVALYFFSSGFSFVQGWVMNNISMKVTYRFRKDISQKINRMPLKYFESTSQGEVLSRITNDVDTVSHSLQQSLTQIITSVTTIIGVLIMMFTISVPMTLTALCIVPLSLVFVMLIVKKSQHYFVDQQDYLGHVNGQVEEVYGGHVVMKAFNGEKECAETFEKYNDTLYKSAWKSQFLSGLIMPATNFVGNLGYVAVCILGGTLAAGGSIAVGDIQAFIQYVRTFTQPISQLANITNILQQTAAAAERVFEFVDEEEESPEAENPIRVTAENGAFILHYTDENGKAVSEPFHGNVSFQHVSFGYNPDKIIVNDFSAEVKAGQKVAIVGPTGAGKTTMVKLLMRFYDVNSGRILIDGHDIKRFTRHDLRSLFGMVLQETWLYNDTIRENIRYGRLDATDDEVLAASKAARVDHFVKTMPDGYDVMMNEESTNVSQGQKQLLTIARAILADPKILILDEATSSVDTKTELDIQKAMDKLMQHRTSFVIAHRLSTIRDADLILVMNNGDIVEQGNHKEL